MWLSTSPHDDSAANGELRMIAPWGIDSEGRPSGGISAPHRTARRHHGRDLGRHRCRQDPPPCTAHAVVVQEEKARLRPVFSTVRGRIFLSVGPICMAVSIAGQGSTDTGHGSSNGPCCSQTVDCTGGCSVSGSTGHAFERGGRCGRLVPLFRASSVNRHARTSSPSRARSTSARLRATNPTYAGHDHARIREHAMNRGGV